jgi:uncharacterized protein
MRSESGLEARLTVLVRPRSARNEVVATAGATVRVRVTAPPADGAANDAVCALVARSLDVPRSRVTIVRGHGARTKLLRIAGLSPDELRARLRPVS